MTRTFLYILGTGSAVALTLASACTVTSVDDDDVVVGAGGTTNATTSQSTTSTGGSGAQGGAGVGGGGDCISCSEFLESATATEDQLCGYDNGTCAPSSSCELALEFSVCVCGPDENTAGACNDQCVTSCGGQGQEDPAECDNCIDAFCSSQFTDCEADTGG